MLCGRISCHFSKTSANFHQTTQCNIPENSAPHSHCSENLNSLMIQLHEAESFLRSRQSRSHSRISQYIMQPEGSREPSTGPYPEPDQSSPYQPILPKIHFNIIHPPMSWSSRWSLSFWLSHQYPICIPLLPICATCPVP
jgi:hypothetical protein